MSMRISKSKIAADNNADLCAAIFKANRLRFERDEVSLLCLDSSPLYYPSMVTLDPDATVEQRLRIERIYGQGSNVVSVKDSFACLDLSDLGFSTLLSASWIWREPITCTAPDNWMLVDNSADLSAWHSAWRLNSANDLMVFPNECLNDPNLVFLMRKQGNTIEAGCLGNLSGEAVGLSNVFDNCVRDETTWGEAADALSAICDNRPIVGYEEGTRLTAARMARFDIVGELHILIR